MRAFNVLSFNHQRPGQRCSRGHHLRCFIALTLKHSSLAFFIHSSFRGGGVTLHPAGSCFCVGQPTQLHPKAAWRAFLSSIYLRCPQACWGLLICLSCKNLKRCLQTHTPTLQERCAHTLSVTQTPSSGGRMTQSF